MGDDPKNPQNISPLMQTVTITVPVMSQAPSLSQVLNFARDSRKLVLKMPFPIFLIVLTNAHHVRVDVCKFDWMIYPNTVRYSLEATFATSGYISRGLMNHCINCDHIFAAHHALAGQQPW